MKFTFKAAKSPRVRNGKVGFSYCAKLDGQIVALGWAPGSREDALMQARIDAEAFGYIDE